MLKKTSSALLKQFFVLSFISLLSTAFILGIGTTPAQAAAKAADAPKSVTALVDINSGTQAELESSQRGRPRNGKEDHRWPTVQIC